MSIMLWQDKYILDILHNVGMSSCKPVDTPISTTKVVMLSDGMFSNPIRFYQIISTLQYLTFIRPYIYFAVNKVCDFMHASTNAH
jgi:histone deacetylase 1/2